MIDKPMTETSDNEIKVTDDGRPMRHVRSFVRREGRMTIRQEAALEMLYPAHGRFLRDGPVGLANWFGREAPCWLEIGFGMGASLVQQAATLPHINFLGIEVHMPGVGAMLASMQASHCNNIRVFSEDAIEILNTIIADDVFDRVQLFFPDPWPKSRHHKRRIVQSAFAQLLRRKLKIGGVFHMATDWLPYAEHMCEVMNRAEGYSNLSPTQDYVPRPDERPHTKFENRGERLGHAVRDLMYKRIS